MRMAEILQKSQKAYVSCLSLLFLSLTLTVRPSMAGPEKPARGRETGGERKMIPIGVILHLDSPLGAMANYTINLAIDEFYKKHPHYRTQIVLLVNDSQNNVVTAAEAARDLIENRKVHAILGPQSLEEARLVEKLGNKRGVPVIWFPLSGPSLLPPPSQSSIRTNQRPCLQFQAMAAIVAAFGWQSIIPISENTEYGSDLIPCLTDALKDMAVRLPYIGAIDPSSQSTDVELQINQTLRVLNNSQTHVFLVHMSPDLGTNFIVRAQKAGMMTEGYAWILTQGLSSLTDPKFLNSMPLKGYMQGAVGVKPIDSHKSNYRREKEGEYSRMNRLQALVAIKRNQFKGRTLTLYGWWAYDTITALAMAVESDIVGIVDSPLPNNGRDNRVDTGPKLRKEIQATYFQGESGAFNLSQGQLEPVFEVYNVIAKRESNIGYWSPEGGLVQNYGEGGEPSGKYPLKQPMWPGDTMDTPPKLKIGVTRTNFTGFADVEWPNGSSRLRTYGFTIDVFNEVLDVLPFPLHYEFVPLPNKTEHLTNGTYDELLCNQMEMKKLDAIIGDITIVVDRTSCVDFTLPYLDSSVSMVVKVRQASISKWILLDPFHWSLWFLLGGIFVGATIIAIILENSARPKKQKEEDNNVRTETEKEKDSERKLNTGDDAHDEEKKQSDDTHDEKKKQSDENELIYNPFLIYKIDIGEDVKSKTARWMVILTSFLFVMVVQVYTANLTSIITEGKKAEPSWADINETINKNLLVGYQRDSWVKGFLVEQGVNESRLRPYRNRDEYNEALSNGPEKGGVDAIVDETPYLDLFLSKYNSDFMRAGPIYKTGGFAFAFPKKSSLVSYFSNAILNVTQDVETFRVLRTKSSLPTTIEDVVYEYQSDSETPSLGIDNFGGLFPVVLYVLGLFFGISIIKSRSVIGWLRSFAQKRRIAQRLRQLRLNFNLKSLRRLIRSC